MEIVRIRHTWPEKAGFTISRPNGWPEYTFLHFWNPVEIQLEGKRILADPSACIIYDLKTPQWFCSHEPLVHDWLHMTGDVPAVLDAIGLHANTLYYASDSAKITELVHTMEQEFYSKQPLSGDLCEIKLKELFITLYRENCVPKAQSKDSRESRLFSDMRQYMFSHLKEYWTIPKMAQTVHLSESRFYVVYKSLYGISPVNDLIRARIESAKYYLSTGYYTVTDIAELCGYNSVFHFIRQFKQVTAMTPTQYAKTIEPMNNLRK